MAVTTAAVIGAASAAAGAASAVKGARDAKKASEQAANAPAATVNIPGLQGQAQNIAIQNAVNSAALERQFNPGAAQLRQGSLEALLASLNPENGAALAGMAAGGPPGINNSLMSQITAQAGQPLATTGFDSALSRAAIERAMGDLSLGGQLPQDVRNLVARNAAARSGTVSGGLGLGRDISARDLGLTSLDLSQRRLQNAAQLGQQEAALEQANAALRSQSEQFGRNNLLQSQGAVAQQDQLAAGNYFNQANLLQSIASGDFARAIAAAQLGQNIAQPASGLDPGSIANLAVGNSNAVANQAQNAAAIKAQSANQLLGLGGNLLGAAGSYYANKTPVPTYNYTPSPTGYYTPAGNVGVQTSGFFGGG